MRRIRRYAHVLERSLAERSILEGSLVNNTPKRSGRTDNRPEREVPSGSLMDSKSASRLEAVSTKDLVLARSMLSVPSVERISRAPDTSNREQKAKTFTPQLLQGLPGVFPPPFAGGVAPEPDFPWPVAGESPPKWDFSSANHPLYGRYVGPTGNAWSKYFKNKDSMSMDDIIPLLPLPVTPVDRAAMYHDIEYFRLSEKYEWEGHSSGSDIVLGAALGWLVGGLTGGLIGAFIGGNEDWQKPWDLGGKGDPNFQRELAIADARLVKNSWSFMAQGLDRGFYGGKFGGEHFLGDLVWSTAITVTHFPLAIIRLTVYGAVSVGYALRDFVKTGNIGQFVESILKTGVNLVHGIGYTLLYETTRGIADFGISLVKAVPGAIDRGLGLRPGTTAGAIVGGVIGGPIGAIVGGISGGIIEESGGCFITTVVVRSLPPSMQEETLNIFRVYRDSYLANSRFGRFAITRYYRLAPSIVRAIEGRQDAELIWGNVWRRYLAPAVMAIRLNKKREAYYLYSRMVSDLARLAGLRDFIPSDKFDGSDCLA